MNGKSKRVKSMSKSQPAAEKANTEGRAKVKAKPRRVKPAADAANGFDFVGKVESLLVKSGNALGGFEFGLRGRHGKRQTFRLDSSDPAAMNAMAQILVAAHASEAKIGVRADAGTDGVPQVRELECRPKIGKAA